MSPLLFFKEGSFFYSDDDEAWGMIDIEGLHFVAAEDVADSQAAAGQHVIEIVKGEPGYSFGIFQWFIQVWVYDTYPLVKMTGISPPGDIVDHVIDHHFRSGNEVLLRVMFVEIIQHEDPLFFQGEGHHFYHAVIVAWGPEIAEAGEEIEGIVEAVRAKDLPHVVNVEIQVIVAEPAGIFDTGGRQVDACHIIALIGEDPGVAPSSAGHIQHPRCGWRVEQGQQAMDEGGCLLFVSFKVQFMVIG